MKGLDINWMTGRLPHSDRHGAMVFDAIREGLWPFKADTIQVYFEYDIDFHRYRILAEVKFKCQWRISHQEYVDAWDLAADPDLEMFKISELMRDAFRNRQDFFDLAPRIYLGEN